MSFSTPVFILLFLPISLILYFVINTKYKKLSNITLLVLSMIFYAWSGIQPLLFLVCIVGISYVLSSKIASKEKNYKFYLVIAILLNLFILAVCKYSAFALSNINWILSKGNVSKLEIVFRQEIIPLGISYFSFSIISYLVDVYKGEIKVSKGNLLKLGTYIMMFPKIISGPIVRYKDIEAELECRTISIEMVQDGIIRFILGLSKKVLLANRLAIMADVIFKLDNSILFTGYAWLGIICYSLQLYLDFSGYSDMAIGLGLIFGFHFKENFDYPYIAKSIKEFWRRWHISLSSWFRDYVYIPLGGSRQGLIKQCRNIIIVFFLTGLWHGASWKFIVWGLFHGSFLILESLGFSKVLKKCPVILQRIYCIVVMLVGWVFFRADGLYSALRYIKNMFIINMNGIKNIEILSKLTNEFLAVLLISIVAATPFFKKNINKYILGKREGIYHFLLLILFVIVLGFVLGDTFNPFIYFKF